MAIISFTLSEEAMGIFHDALGCISKFAEEVCLEARKDKVRAPKSIVP
jgi:cell cycle checkpoint control protein RAD9A